MAMINMSFRHIFYDSKVFFLPSPKSPPPTCPLQFIALARDLEPQELPGWTVGSVHTVDPTLTPYGHIGLIG